MPPTPADRLRRLLAARALARLVASPRGRAFQLSWMAHAEENDEGLFDTVLSRVDEPDLHRMVRIHGEDERRHAGLFRECVARLGVVPEPVPDDLFYVGRISRIAGGGVESILTNPSKRDGIMEFYAMLQVVEERGVVQFALVEQALRAVDPESAAVVARVIEDEKRHVKYAQAISRRYAPDEATLAETLRIAREIEARAFVEHGHALLRFFVDRDLLAVHGLERLFWRALATLSAPRRIMPTAQPAAA